MTTEPLELAYRHILERIKAASLENKTTCIAASKGQPIETIEQLYKFGCRDFGENYVQELVRKAAALKNKNCADIRWHFLGHLQTNKVKTLLPYIYAIHTVDSEKLAQELAKRWQETEHWTRGQRLPVFIEVNIDQESTKAGIPLDTVDKFATLVGSIPQLALQGLMCIPSAKPLERYTYTAFEKLRDLEQSCRPHTAGALSMGMSDDFEAAIKSGATHVRIGTAIFGERPPHRK